MTLSLRPYQNAAIQSIYDYFQTATGNPLIVVPTAGGKSLVMSSFVEGVLKAYPEQRILIVTHVRELIEQKAYFVLHAPRQVGKTTSLLTLARALTAEGRFEYEGHTFKSLTAVARHITGQHWSGPLFFGFGKGGTR